MATIAARPPRRLGAPLVLVIPALLFGLIVTVQWRTQQERSELTVRYNAPLLDAANSLQNEQNTLKAQLADLRAQLDQIQQGAASQSTASRDLQARIEELRDIKQRRDVYGLGFRVTRASSLRVPAYGGALNVKYGTPQ